MNAADELAFWYELRDLLRSDFIRCMEQGRPFPRARQHMLDRVEDVVAGAERLKRIAQRRSRPHVIHRLPTSHPPP